MKNEYTGEIEFCHTFASHRELCRVVCNITTNNPTNSLFQRADVQVGPPGALLLEQAGWLDQARLEGSALLGPVGAQSCMLAINPDPSPTSTPLQYRGVNRYIADFKWPFYIKGPYLCTIEVSWAAEEAAGGEQPAGSSQGRYKCSLLGRICTEWPAQPHSLSFHSPSQEIRLTDEVLMERFRGQVQLSAHLYRLKRTREELPPNAAARLTAAFKVGKLVRGMGAGWWE